MELVEQSRVVKLEAVDPAAMLRTAEDALETARSLVIDSQDMYGVVGDELRAVKASINALDARRKAITKPLDVAKAEVMDLFRRPIELRTEAESIMKRAMSVFLQKQEDEARQRRIDAEKLAKIEQDKAAEAARVAAAEAKALADAAAQATTFEEQQEAAGKAQVAQAKAAEMEMVAATQMVAYTAPSRPVAAGVSGNRIKWSGEVTDKAALIAFIATRPDLINLLDVNASALNRMVSAQQDVFSMPGVKVNKERVIAARAA